MSKKVLFIGFSAIQLELVKKLLAFRKLTEQLAILNEQRSGEPVDGYVLNADHQGGEQRLALYTRLHPAPVMCVGQQHQAQAHVFQPGPFNLKSVDALWTLLNTAVSAPVNAPVSQPVTDAPAVPKVANDPAGEADVLVVDDSDIVRRSMVSRLNEYGKHVHLAASGEDALAMLPGHRYRLVFLDVMMSGMDGLEVCKRIKRSRDYRDTAVYMLTSKGGMFDKVRANMAGCDGYLIKPLENHKLREVLDKYFDRPSKLPNSSLLSDVGGPEDLNEAELRVLQGSQKQHVTGRVSSSQPTATSGLTASPVPVSPTRVPGPAAPMSPPLPSPSLPLQTSPSGADAPLGQSTPTAGLRAHPAAPDHMQAAAEQLPDELPLPVDFKNTFAPTEIDFLIDVSDTERG